MIELILTLLFPAPVVDKPWIPCKTVGGVTLYCNPEVKK